MTSSRPLSARQKVAAAAAAGLVLACGFGLVQVLRPGPSTPVPGPAGTPPASPAPSGTGAEPAGTVPVTVYVDGWSLSTVGALRWSPASTAAEQRVDAAAGDVIAFAPVTGDDVADLGARHPQVLTQVAARMVTTDRTLVCGAEGCRRDGGDVDLDWFTDPAAIPALGESYAGYQVGAAVYRAVLDVPVGTAYVRIGAEGSSAFYGRVADADATATVPPGAAEEATGRAPGDGIADNVFLLAAGLGRVFVPDAAWLGGDADTAAPGTRTAPPTPTGPVTDLPAGPLFTAGLAAADPASAGLDDSQMTLLTSPSAGCGGYALCVPRTLEAAVSQVSVTQVDTCVAGQADAHAPVVLVDSTWTVTFPQPTHMAGVWDGRTADQLAGYRADGSLFGGAEPVLVSGPQQLRVVQALVYSGPGTGQLVSIQGATGQYGKDDPEFLARRYDVGSLDQLGFTAQGACPR